MSHKQLTFKDKFTFWKYKGQLIGDIHKENNTYLVWCITQIEWFDLIPDDRKVVVKKYKEDAMDHLARVDAWAMGNIPDDAGFDSDCHLFGEVR